MASKKSSDMKPVSGIWSGSARLAIIAGGVAVVLLLVSMLLRPSSTELAEADIAEIYDINVVTLSTEKGAEILYRAYTPVKELTIEFPASEIESLTVVEGEDAITLKKQGEGVSLSSKESYGLVAIEFDFQARGEQEGLAVRTGTNAAVLNMSYFNPVRVNGKSVKNNKESLNLRWLGGGAPFETDRIQIYSDIGLPVPVSSLLAPAADQLTEHYTSGFGQPLSRIPQLMFLYAEGQDGQLSVEGEAVPGQAVVRYIGKGYQNDTPEMRRLVIFNLAHELVHLWQLQHEQVADTPDWLHEGVANALAAEALYISRLWEEADYVAALEAAKADCASFLRSGSLEKAAARGDAQAGYACGHMVAAALAPRMEGGTVLSMWRAFSDRASIEEGGMTADAFYAFAAEWSGSPAFASSLRSFVTSNYRSANGEKIIDRLFAGSL